MIQLGIMKVAQAIAKLMCQTNINGKLHHDAAEGKLRNIFNLQLMWVQYLSSGVQSHVIITGVRRKRYA